MKTVVLCNNGSIILLYFNENIHLKNTLVIPFRYQILVGVCIALMKKISNGPHLRSSVIVQWCNCAVSQLRTSAVVQFRRSAVPQYCSAVAQYSCSTEVH